MLSRQLYGILEGTDMPCKIEGRPQGGSECSNEEGQNAAELRLRTEGSGLLMELFSMESPETLQEMLHVSELRARMGPQPARQGGPCA